MYARTIFGLILLWPMFAHAVERDHRQSADESNTNVVVRVRLIEVSLTKLKGLGSAPGSTNLSWPGSLPRNRSEIDRQLGLFVQKSVAKVIRDETIVVAVGSEARIHAGTESMPDLPSKANPGEDDIGFDGTDIVLAPRLQADRRLVIELLCKQSRSIVLANEPPQQRVHEIATVVELAENEAIVLNGEKDKRVEAVVGGAFPRASAALGRVTYSQNEVQTFVVVSREPRLSDEAAAAVEMQE